MKAEKGFMHLLIAGEVILLVLLVIFGVVKKVAGPEEPTDIVINTQSNQMDNFVDVTTEDAEETESTEEEILNVTFSDDVERVLAEMSLEEKVAQLFMVSPEALTNNSRVTIAGDGTRSALTAYPVGGMVYAKSNYLGRVQMRDLLQGAQNMSNEISGRYLFEGTLVEIGEETVIACAFMGQEEVLVELIVTNNVETNPAVEDMEHILYVEELEAIPQEREAETLYCYSVSNGGPAAIEALSSGADMLCVTEGFTAVYDAVLEAVNAGELSEETLRQAVGRVLTRKQAQPQ